ncbi:acetyl-CoA carboxylase biotin carboxylase subunit [Nonomuraea sp. NPDC049725]|uniref:acetyl-CoA carboxylase biotin carboxylase subunit n=1 Tax=Nonomuraea sp. NPDC049725 TaxID=3154508 RepID=UPI00343A4CA9
MERLLVANRGEIAVRIVRACRDLGIGSVVAYSSADRDSLAVRIADRSVHIGPAPARRSYNDIPSLLYACALSEADAVHPGYGFLSEEPLFATACAEVGVTFVGPSAKHIALMGNKLDARAAMRACGVPVLPGSDGPVESAHEAAEEAARIGYPLILKAVAGGGGRGMRVVRDPGELARTWEETRAVARTLFRDDRIYLERYVPRGRHIEVQILADSFGNVVDLGERDCTVQRRHQKLAEESPAPSLPGDLRERLRAAAVLGATSVEYVSAGTMEFLVSDEGEPYFLEMNTRLQVEHPVTEERTGIDLVEWMIRIARGEALPFGQRGPDLGRHAVEVRINAEDVARDWAGSTGRVERLRLPGGPGIRVDTHLYEGYVVPPFYDSLLAKIIATGPTREVALRRMDRALREFSCEGVVTNADFHRTLLSDAGFRAGDYRLDLVEDIVDRLCTTERSTT